MSFDLEDFVRESNRIEGILRDPTSAEIAVHEVFLAKDQIRVMDLEAFVMAVAEARLRDQPGMNVRVGNHTPPPGGPKIEATLAMYLHGANNRHDPFRLHQQYETLHPFMDGNGRSGRVLWLWMMGGEVPLGFLHTWYYQSLSAPPRL